MENNFELQKQELENKIQALKQEETDLLKQYNLLEYTSEYSDKKITEKYVSFENDSGEIVYMYVNNVDIEGDTLYIVGPGFSYFFGEEDISFSIQSDYMYPLENTIDLSIIDKDNYDRQFETTSNMSISKFKEL